MSKPLTKLDGAFELIRTSFDPAWAAVALLIAVMLGGFGWLSARVNRIEAKVDAVLLEIPGLLQRDLQAQTEKLTALINTSRQSGRAVPAASGIAPTLGGTQAPSPRSGTDVPHVVNNRPGATGGAASNVNTTAGSNSTAAIHRRP
jgi:hypothetical protein